MPILKFETIIEAPIGICFDVARNIDVHKLSTGDTNEEAIGGVTSGLIGFGEEVTWQATHFGIRQKLTSKITAFHFPYYFRDEMKDGPFKSLKHDHRFEEKDGFTLMRDHFEFESPLGVAGRIFNHLVLNKYLSSLIAHRNEILKAHAQSLHLNPKLL